ncbi:MAG: hypothetical protein ACU84J_09125 [Gammaproteobacteria bacterium]
METKLDGNEVSALPILPRTDATVWTAVRNARDEIYKSVDNFTHQRIKALILKSNDFEFPAWVKIEIWISQNDPLLTERSSAIFRIYPKAFHKYELEYTIELENRGQKKTYERLYDIQENDITRVVQYLIKGGQKPKFGHKQIRRRSWELWKPKNKTISVRRDWKANIALAVLVIGVIAWVSAYEFGVLLFLAGGIALYFLAKRPVLVRTPGKPKEEPRRLRRVDSWQTVISGLGSSYETMQNRLKEALKNPPTDSVRHQVERIWYWGLDSVVEREQIAISLGRGIVFCQIYQYENELYVGWDGHLNLGQWVETDLTKGIDKATGHLVKVNKVEAGYQNISEYDVTDLSCLMEWVHAKLTNSLKELMAEYKIEQEIDFQILRGERQNLTQSAQQTSTTKKTMGLFGNLKRTG